MNRRPPAWLWPNLLSLDAPIVACIWMWMLARAMRVQYVELSSYAVLAAAVWCVYVLDRIKDVFSGKHPVEGEMPWRHEFHWKLKWLLLVLVAAVIVYSGYSSLYVLSREMLSAGLVGAFLVLVYFVVAAFDRADVAYGKNFFAGMVFAFGTAVPVVIYSQPMPAVLSDVIAPLQVALQEGGAIAMLGGILLALKEYIIMVLGSLGVVLFSVHVVLFGLLCVMNITAIDLWERSRRSDDQEVKDASEFSLSAGLMALVAGAMISAAFFVDDYGRPLCYAVMISAALLQVINRKRYKFSLDAQRVLADIALVVPAPLMFFLS
ncbi:hypothetical protein [Rubritalea halochordaticola]